MSESVLLYEMSARDGLQSQKNLIKTADKIALVNKLSACEFRKIEVTSFVSPKWVPQLADASAVMAGIERAPGTVYAALTPNLQGFEAARRSAAQEIAVFASASESFSQKNINCSIAQSLQRFAPVIQAAKQIGLPVRGYVSCVTHCPYEGPIAPQAVAQVVAQMLAAGCFEVSLGDTIGAATPESTDAMLAACLNCAPAGRLAGHFHDTQHRALENIQVSLARGLRTFDASVGGLGGCPYAPGAKGNVDTQKVHALVQRLGYETGIDAQKLALAAQFAQQLGGLNEL